MRTQIVRAALRASGSQPYAVAQPIISRAFCSTPIVCKKKVKTALDDGLDEVAIEENDDLFGETTSAPTEKPAKDLAAARAKFASALSAWESRLEWTKIDAGKPPSLHTFKSLAAQATTKEEFTQLLSLSKTYRDRVGSLGLSRGFTLAARGARAWYPELVLNGFLDRYASGLEFDLDLLYILQRGFLDKLMRCDREKWLESASLEGAPESTIDLLAPPETEGDDGKAQVVEQLDDLELARAKLSFIDRMALLSSLVPNVNRGKQDPLILSYLPAAYIRAFNLRDLENIKDPRYARITARLDEIITLLVESTKESKQDKDHELIDGAEIRIMRNLATVLTYLKRVKDEQEVLKATTAFYAYMDKVRPNEATLLIKKVEPILQKQPTQ